LVPSSLLFLPPPLSLLRPLGEKSLPSYNARKKWLKQSTHEAHCGSYPVCHLPRYFHGIVVCRYTAVHTPINYFLAHQCSGWHAGISAPLALLAQTQRFSFCCGTHAAAGFPELCHTDLLSFGKRPCVLVAFCSVLKRLLLCPARFCADVWSKVA